MRQAGPIVKGLDAPLASPAGYELPPLPDAENTQLKLHHTYGNDEPVALAQYQATFPDGSTRTGQLDNQGKATLDGVPPGCAFVDYHTQPDPINPEGKPWNKPKEGPPDISMLAQRDNTPAAAPETETTPEPEATPETEPEYTFGEEATKVLSDKWEGFTGSVATGVAALPFVGDDAARAQARADVWQGVKDQYNGIRALSPPNIFDFGESAIGLATGDPEQAAAVSRKWDETQNTWGNVADNAVNSWNEAEQRNGTLGALEMSTFAIGSELLGGKGTGVVGKAGRVGNTAEEAAGAARRTDEVPGNASDWVRPKGWRLPVTKGAWQGTPGNSPWLSQKESVNAITGGKPIPFKEGYPDFSEWSEDSFEFDNLTGKNSDFSVVHETIAKEYGLANKAQAKNFLREAGLTPHHHQDGRTIQLIPSTLHNEIPHIGGAAKLRNGR